MSDMLAFGAMHYSFIPQITDDISVMINELTIIYHDN